jgi:hypothetical protein
MCWANSFNVISLGFIGLDFLGKDEGTALMFERAEDEGMVDLESWMRTPCAGHRLNVETEVDLTTLAVSITGKSCSTQAKCVFARLR